MSDGVTLAHADDWLRRYGRAWEDGDVETIGALFAEHATYREKAFDEPMRGRAAICDYWKEGADEGQRDVTFGHEVWAVNDSECYAHWWAAFTRTANGHRVRLDGVFRLVFNAPRGDHLLCRELQEWWHADENE